MIEISKHAHRQWRRRSDTPGLDLRLAWVLGVVLDGIEEFDEGRYDHRSETVLFRRGTTLVTVYDARDVNADLQTKINDCRGATA